MTSMDTNVAAYPVQDGTGQDMQFVCGRVTLGTAATLLRIACYPAREHDLTVIEHG